MARRYASVLRKKIHGLALPTSGVIQFDRQPPNLRHQITDTRSEGVSAARVGSDHAATHRAVVSVSWRSTGW